MKHLMTFEKKRHNRWNVEMACRSYGIHKNYTMDKYGMISVNDNVNIEHKKFTEIPIPFDRVSGDFFCGVNHLKNLNNAPVYVGGHFNCAINDLTTLIDGPKSVGGNYICYNNLLKDVYGFPEFFNGIFTIKTEYLSDLKKFSKQNPVCEIIEIVHRDVKNKFIKFLNEYLVIRNGDTIIESRLLDALYEVGIKEVPKHWENHKFKNYKLV